MKRAKPLARKKGLSRRAGPSPGKGGLKRAAPETKVARAAERLRTLREEPGYAAWHAPQRGKCSICRRPGPLVRHHVVQEQVIRRRGGDPHDLRWSLLLGRYCDCHAGQHDRGVNDRRLDYRQVERHAPDAIRLAHQLLGDGAPDYFARRYRNAPDPNDRREQPCQQQPQRT